VSDATTRWWWIRHAPVVNPDRTIYGQRDIAVDTSDSAAMVALAARLPKRAVWLATPLTRTQRTAAAIAAHLPAPIGTPQIEPDLIEQSFGDWQGRTYAEIGGASAHRFWLSPAHVTPPQGESFVAMVGRVGAAIDRLTERHRGQDVVAIAHGGTIRAALAHALAIDPEVALAFTIETLSLTRLDRIEGPAPGHSWRVVQVNAAPLPVPPHSSVAGTSVLDKVQHPDREVR
jgi:alpha-ribazole phosphatase